MFRELKSIHSYPKVMAFLSVLSFISALAFSFAGELFLPFAVAFYSALLLFENPNKRIFSFIIPVLTVVISVVLTDLYSLITLEYVLISLVLVLSYINLAGKGECAVYMTVITALFVFLSLYLGAARTLGSFDYNLVIGYYSEAFANIRDKIINILSSYTMQAGEATAEPFMTQQVAAYYVDYLSKLAVSFVGIFAFVLSGIALKLFTRIVFHYSEEGITKKFANFIPSNAVAYIYVICAIINAFSNMGTVFAITVVNAYTILMIPFAYVGFKYLSLMDKIHDRKILRFLLIFAILFMSGLAFPLLSYFGVFVTISTNKSSFENDRYRK